MLTDCLKWFSKKAFVKATAAIAGIQQSLDQGFWVKGVSRSARAVLGKGNVAIQWARNNTEALERFGVPPGTSQYDDQYREIAHMGWNVRHCMYFGHFENIHEVNFDLMDRAARNDQERELVKVGRDYAASFADVAAAFKQLDATRPQTTKEPWDDP